jgi:hypothetical protein
MDLAQLDAVLDRLRREPHSAGAREALLAGARDAASGVTDWVKRLEIARARHEARGEYRALASLIECEVAALGDEPELAWDLMRELARIYHEELLADAEAIEWLERARRLKPDEDIDAEIEHLRQLGTKWDQIAERFSEEAAGATEGALRRSLLARAAGLVWQYGGRGRDVRADTLFESAIKADPSGVHVSRAFLVTLREREEWERVGEVAVRAAEGSVTAEDRAGFLAQAAEAYGKIDGGAAARERVQDELGLLDPSDEEALAVVARRLTNEERWDELASLYERALRSRQAAEAERGTLLQVAMIHWRMRGEPRAAEAFFARLARLEPTHPAVLEFYRAECFDSGAEPERYLAALSDALRALGNQPAAIELAAELARTTEQIHGAGDRVVELWRAVERLEPGHGEARGALRRIYRATEKWNALMDLLRVEVEATPREETGARLSLLREMLVISRDELKLTAMVIAMSRAILEVAPGDEAALAELERALEETGRLPELADLLKARALGATDLAERRARFEKLGTLARDRLQNTSLATEVMEALVDLDPTAAVSLEQLGQAYERARDWRKLRGVLERQLARATTPPERLNRALELSALLEQRLQDETAALAMLSGLLAEFPEDARVVEGAERLAHRRGDHGVLAAALEAAVRIEPDARARTQKLRRLAALYRDELHDTDRAVATLERLVGEDGTNSRAFRLLADTYAARGDWDELERISRAKGDLEGFAEALGSAAESEAEPTRRVALSLRAGRLFADELGKAERAVRHFERVLLVEPSHAGAAAWLEPVYERSEQWSRLAQTKTVRLQALGKLPRAEGGSGAAEDREARAAIAEELADITALRLEDAARGFEWMLGAYEAAPDAERRLEKLERYARGADALPRFVAEVGRLATELSPVDAAAARGRLARLLAGELADREGATVHLEAALEHAPDRAAVSLALRDQYRALGRFSDLRALLESEIEGAAPDTARTMLLELAMLLEERMGDASSAAAVYERVLALDPEDASTALTLERLYRAEGNDGALELNLERLVAIHAKHDPRAAVESRLRLAETRAFKRGDAPRALDELEAVLGESTGDERAIALIDRIREQFPGSTQRAEGLLEQAYEARSSHANLRDVLERKLRSTSSADDREHAEERLVDLLAFQLADEPAAFERVKSIVERRPGEARWWQRFEELGERLGAHSAVLETYSRVMAHRTLDADSQRALAERAVQFGQRTKAEPAKLTPFYERLFHLDPRSGTAFQALRELYIDSARFRELEGLLEVRIAAEDDAEAKLQILLEAAFVYEEVLDDAAHATQVYERIAREHPTQPIAHKALLRLYRRSMRWDALVPLLESELPSLAPEDKVRTAQEIGEVLRKRLHDPARALPFFELALSLDPGFRKARDAVLSYFDDQTLAVRAARIIAPHLAETREWPAYAAALRVLLGATDDAAEESRLLGELSRVLEDELRDAPAAFEVTRKLVEAHPERADARLALARLAGKRDSHRERAEVLEAARRRLESSAASPKKQGAKQSGKKREVDGSEELRTTLLLEAASVWDVNVGDSARAESAYRTALTVLAPTDPRRVDVLRALDRLLQHQTQRIKQDPSVLTALLAELVDHAPDAHARRALHERIADAEAAHGNWPAALSALGTAMAEASGDVRLAEKFVELGARAGDKGAQAKGLESLEQWAADAGARERAVLARAELLMGTEDGAAKATQALRSFAAKDAATARVLGVLADLEGEQGSWDAAVATLERAVAASESAGERRALALRAARAATEHLADGSRALAVLSSDVFAEDAGESSEDLEAARVLLALATGSPPSPAANRVRAAQLARPRFERRAEWLDVLALLEVSAALDTGDAAFGAMIRGFEVAHGELGDADAALAWLRRAAEAAPRDRVAEVMDGVRKVAAVESPAKAASVAAATCAELLAAKVADSEARASLLSEAARYAKVAGDEALAAQLYREAWSADPSSREAGVALEAAARLEDDKALLANILEKRLAQTTEARERVPVLLELGDLYEGPLDDPGAAERSYQLLEGAGELRLRAQRMERLLSTAERWGDLAKFLEAEIARGSVDAIETHFRLGELARDRFGDPERAMAHFKAVLARKADHAPTAALLGQMLAEPAYRLEAAELLEPYFVQRLEWRKVAEVLDARIEAEDDTAERKRLLHRRALILEEYLEDLDGAFIAYAALLKEDAGDRAARDVLERLARVLSRELDLAVVYADMVAGAATDSPEVVALARSAGFRFARSEEHVDSSGARPRARGCL